MTDAKFELISSRQTDDDTRKRLSDYMIDTGYDGYADSKYQFCSVLERIIENKPFSTDFSMNKKPNTVLVNLVELLPDNYLT